MILVLSGIGSMLTIVGLFVRLTWWLSKEFSAVRKLIHERVEAIEDDALPKRDERILRLEYWAVQKGFQPGIKPFNGGGGGHHD